MWPTVGSANHQVMQGRARPRNHCGMSMPSTTTWAITTAKMMVMAGRATARNSSVKTLISSGLDGLMVCWLDGLPVSAMFAPYAMALGGSRELLNRFRRLLILPGFVDSPVLIRDCHAPITRGSQEHVDHMEDQASQSVA